MKGAILAADKVLPPDGAVPPPWPARRVVIDGAMLHVRDTPATAPGAEPAVYVHGLGGSSQNWTDFAGLLTDRFDAEAEAVAVLGQRLAALSAQVEQLQGELRELRARQ